MCPCHEEKEAGGRVDLCDKCKDAGCDDHYCELPETAAPEAPVDPPAESS